MRTTMLSLAAVLILLVAPGCGDDNKGNEADMTMAPADMSATPADMSKIATCAAALSCIVGCGANATCAAGCQNVTATAGQYLLPFETCLFATCGPGDGGMNKCSMLGDTSSMCISCVSGIFVGSSSAGNACHAEYAACVSH